MPSIERTNERLNDINGKAIIESSYHPKAQSFPILAIRRGKKERERERKKERERERKIIMREIQK